LTSFIFRIGDLVRNNQRVSITRGLTGGIRAQRL
jgi:hypothetical protein